MRAVGVNTLHDKFGISIEENLRLIKAAGFDCVFSSFTRSFPLKSAVSAAKKLNLEYETLHAPFTACGLEENLNSMWRETGCGEQYLKLLLECVDACAQNGIEKCVIHNAVTENPPPVSEIGLERFSRLFSYAKKCGVRMAVENLESEEHLSRLMELTGDFHGFCWDCGHNLCYTPMTDIMSLYGKKLICTHVDDNKGVTRPGIIHYTDDLHLMPFDGALNWEWYAGKIKSCGYTGPLTLELKDDYLGVGAAKFYELACKRALKLCEMCM